MFSKIPGHLETNMLVKDFYTYNKIDPNEFTLTLWLENCVGKSIGIPHKYEELSIKDACNKLLEEGDQLLQEKGCLPSSFIHHTTISKRKYCLNLLEECKEAQIIVSESPQPNKSCIIS